MACRIYKLTRDAVSLETPDGKTIPLPTLQEYRAGNTQALQAREKGAAGLDQLLSSGREPGVPIGFFSDLDDKPMSWDEVELSPQRACLGRLFFKVPGGIQYGQHWLNVKFANSVVRVPFRILTKEEEKTLNKNYGDIRKQVQDAFKPPKK